MARHSGTCLLLLGLLLLIAAVGGEAARLGRRRRGAVRARTIDSSTLTMPVPSGSTGITKDKWNWAQAMPGNCVASASADLASRVAEAQWEGIYTGTSRWGPSLKSYSPVNASQIPLACHPTTWAWARMRAFLNNTKSQGLNYCHHHAPNWVTPTSQRSWCNPLEAGVDQADCVCNSAGVNNTKPWQGVDCSNYAAFLYDIAFGFYPTSSIGNLACGSVAPGKLLSGIGPSRAAELAPGDLLFVTLSRTGRTLPIRVSHVVVWTGWQVDFTRGATGPLANATLFASVPPKQLEGVKACVASRRAAGKPVWVISDSTHAGPALRPFCGWYLSAFSHARRIIDANATLPQDDPSVAFYNITTGDCMSKGVLNTFVSSLLPWPRLKNALN